MSNIGDDPPGWIICPVTGRRWPAIKGFELKNCTACGGKIDIRTESWYEGPKHYQCPEQTVIKSEPIQVTTPNPVPKAVTGKEVIAEMDKFRDTVHEAWLNDPGRRQGDESHEGQSV